MSRAEERAEMVVENELYLYRVMLRYYERCALDAYTHLQNLQNYRGKKGYRWVRDRDIRHQEAVFEDYVERANKLDDFIKGGGPDEEEEIIAMLDGEEWYPESLEDTISYSTEIVPYGDEEHDDYLPQ